MLNLIGKKLKLQGELKKQEKFERIIEEKQFSYNDVHELVVVDGPKTDIQAVVDAHKDKAGLKNMLALFAKTQDASVLGFHNVSYGDLSGIDSDEKDVLKVVNGADASTKKLAAYLGVSQEELLKMSTDQITEAVTKKALEASKPTEEKKEGE